MFPLGSVVVPSSVLPLHVFEPRYRQMMDDVMESESQSFGVVLIERGHEVGGQDQRLSVGTLARVVETERTDDGRWAVIAVGVHRIVVDEWLTDDPYPRAVVSDWPDSSTVTDDHVLTYEAIRVRHRRLLGIATELGHDVGPLPELSEDPLLGSYQLVATAPLSTMDRYAVLAAADLEDRLPLVSNLIDSALELAEMEMGQALLDPLGEDE